MYNLLVIIIGLVIIGFLVYIMLRLRSFGSQDLQVGERLGQQVQIQSDLKNLSEKIKNGVERLEKEREIRKQLEDENIERTKKLEAIIAGTHTKGLSGENILREIFKQFPKEMIATNFMIGGKVVEFGLVLPNKKIMPIDSKWTASDLILSLEKETSLEKRGEIIEKIEKEVIKRIKEVKQYIDPAVTWSQAILALPDSVYSVCKKPHLEAQKTDILLMPYSMALPLLLYMYRLHLQYAQSLDIENLQSHLVSVSRNLNEMETILENQVARGSTMISNAYSTYKQIISRIKSSLTELQIKYPEEKKKIEKPK